MLYFALAVALLGFYFGAGMLFAVALFQKDIHTRRKPRHFNQYVKVVFLWLFINN
jgi:hypothetical protein